MVVGIQNLDSEQVLAGHVVSSFAELLLLGLTWRVTVCVVLRHGEPGCPWVFRQPQGRNHQLSLWCVVLSRSSRSHVYFFQGSDLGFPKQKTVQEIGPNFRKKEEADTGIKPVMNIVLDKIWLSGGEIKDLGSRSDNDRIWRPRLFQRKSGNKTRTKWSCRAENFLVDPEIQDYRWPKKRWQCLWVSGEGGRTWDR